MSFFNQPDAHEENSQGGHSDVSSDWYDSDEVSPHKSREENLSYLNDIGPNNKEAEQDNGSDSDGESLEEYRNVVSTQFASEKEGYKFYLDYAKKKGFSVRKDILKYNSDGLPTFRKFCCSFAGFKRHREPKIRQTRRSKRVGCTAFLAIKFDYQSSKWYVYNFVDNHNHKLVTTKEEMNLLRFHRKIPDDHKARLLFLQGTGLRKYEAINTIEAEYGGPENLPYNRKDVYNFFESDRLTKIAKGDAETVLQKLKELQAADADFFFDFKKDKDGHLTHLFWSDSQSREDYRSFGDVLLFDSTYRMNMYCMPFVPFVGSNHHRSTVIFACGIVFDETEESFIWLLRTFLRAMYQVHPKSVITDGDHAMRKAIKDVFPNSHHRLCIWHIELNMSRNLHSSMMVGFRTLRDEVCDPLDFEVKWSDYLKRFKISANNKWFNDMYKLKGSWASTFLQRELSLGMRTTQRSESLNAILHKHLSHSMSLIDLFLHYERCLAKVRRKEVEMDFESSLSLPVLRTNFQNLERNAAQIYTAKVFELVQEEIRRSAEYSVEEVLQDDERSTTFLVSWANNKPTRKLSRVVCSGGDRIACSCPKLVSEGIPCRHLFKVLTHLEVTSIPSCCILLRWTKNAKSRVTSSQNSVVYHWSEQLSMYHDLTNLGNTLFNKASKDKGSYVATKKLVQEALQQDIQDKVLDPNKVKTKGRPKRQGNFIEKRVYKCGHCKRVGHSTRTCPEVKFPNTSRFGAQGAETENATETMSGLKKKAKNENCILEDGGIEVIL